MGKIIQQVDGMPGSQVGVKIHLLKNLSMHRDHLPIVPSREQQKEKGNCIFSIAIDLDSLI